MSSDVAIWSVIEPAVGIIAACVTTFRPLVKYWGFGWNSTGNYYPSGHVQLSNVNQSDRFGEGFTRRTGTQKSRHRSVVDSRSGASEKGFIHVSKTVHIQVETRSRSPHDEETGAAGQPEGAVTRQSSETEIRSLFEGPNVRASRGPDGARRDEWGVSVPGKAYGGY